MQLTASTNSNKIKDWVIYKIINPNNNVYIGRTSKLDYRVSVHLPKRNKTGGNRNIFLLDSINKFGRESHKIEILEKFSSTINYANAKEIFWIRTFMSNRNIWPEMNGFNLTQGGNGFLGKHTNEVKEKMSKSHIGINRTKQHSENISKSRIKPVLKYDLNMNLLGEYKSVRDANLSIGGSMSGGNISNVCRGKLRQAKGFIFKYK